MRQRLVSLDVFRGITIAGMLLVNNPGTWGAIFPPLEHAEWHGWTPTDLIFPFFLFIVGITTHISLSARRARGDDEGAIVRQILRRGAIIFLLGFLMAWFPFYQYGKVPGMDDPSFMDRFIYRLQHVRIMGVLARIGVVYIASALLTLRSGSLVPAMLLHALHNTGMVLLALWLGEAADSLFTTSQAILAGGAALVGAGVIAWWRPVVRKAPP